MLKTFKTTLKDLFSFLKKPKDKQDINQSREHKAKRLFSLLVLDIPIMFLLTLIINKFSKLGWVKVEDHQITSLLNSVPFWVVFLLVVVIIPFIEEIILDFF